MMNRILSIFRPVSTGIALSVALFFLLCSSELSAQWTKVSGFPADNAHMLFFPSDNRGAIAVATDDIPVDDISASIKFSFGNGFLLSLDSGKTFAPTPFHDYSVSSIVQMPDNPNVWLAAVEQLTTGGVLISYDYGKTWLDTLFPRCSQSQINKLLIRPGTPTRFMGALTNTAGGTIISLDTFATCSTAGLVANARDISFSKASSFLYLGGDGYPYGGVFRSMDNGQSWDQDTAQNIRHLRVLAVQASSSNPALVLCGADSLTSSTSSEGKGIYRSLDSGRTWDLRGAPGARIYSIVEHPRDPHYLIAAGDSGVWISGSYGAWWNKVTDGLPQGARVRAVGFPDWEIPAQGPIAFVGLISGGLYKSGPLVGVGEERLAGTQLTLEPNYPNPFNGTTYFHWFNPAPQLVHIGISDMMGREVATLLHSFSAVGDHIGQWNADNIMPGMYLLTVSAGTEKAYRKLVVVK